MLTSRARARRVRFGPPDRLSPLGEVYLQPALTAGHGTGEGGRRERGGEKMVWEPDRFNARVAHRLFMTARKQEKARSQIVQICYPRSYRSNRLAPRESDAPTNARLRLTFYSAPVAYCGPARPGSAFQQSAVSGLLPRARVGVASAEIWSPRPTLPI